MSSLPIPMAMNEVLEQKLAELPSTPGVYLFRGRGGQILYVGKARSLKDRVRSYFHGSRIESPRLDRLVESIRDLEVVATDTEREALVLLKEARRRDESRRRRAMQDLEVLDRMEEELLEEGKGDMTDNRRLMLARRVKEIRWKMQELNNRIENIYNKRLKVLNEHVASLETVLELTSEALPDKRSMEDMAIKAKQLLEDLEKTKELAEGIALTPESAVPDDEEKEILREMENRSVPEEVKPEPVHAEPEEKTSTKTEKKTERPVKQEEPPEIMFEE